MRLKALLLGLLCMAAGLCNAQSGKVEESEQTVNGVNRRGQQLTVQLDPKFVEKLWKDQLTAKTGKTKVKFTKGVYTIDGAVLDTITSSPMRIISTVGSGPEGSFVWWSLDMGVAYVDKKATPKEYAAAEGFMQAFARKAYKEDIFRQINQAEDVLKATIAEQERVVKQANDIQTSITKNQQRKQELEAELVKNADDLKKLEQEVQNNLKKQEASKLQVLEMEKAVEAVRAKLMQVK
ncbi:coiled-coil domain-containing protein [Pontibacter fetidus]|uniref:DNA repair ATPase n=1 Tax=Pontibacter fetidus TaxID=2700082 RepID=A0A6B2GWA7_9BACT|nr:DNA repair ATPase [Pontibacter fetidus]NDK55209.1 DNA repair ATPase [Pontibacter fetidus]